MLNFLLCWIYQKAKTRFIRATTEPKYTTGIDGVFGLTNMPRAWGARRKRFLMLLMQSTQKYRLEYSSHALLCNVYWYVPRMEQSWYWRGGSRSGLKLKHLSFALKVEMEKILPQGFYALKGGNRAVGKTCNLVSIVLASRNSPTWSCHHPVWKYRDELIFVKKAKNLCSYRVVLACNWRRTSRNRGRNHGPALHGYIYIAV